MLRRRGAVGNRLQTRAHWPAQLLSRRRGRRVKSPGRQTNHRPFALQTARPTGGGIRSFGHRQADWRCGTPIAARATNALEKSLLTLAEIEAELAGEQSEAGGG